MMQKQNNPKQAPIKPDLKHDNMEYNASTDGDDRLDADRESAQEIEEEEITAAELEQLHNDDLDEQAAALNSVELDRQADADNFLLEQDDEPEEEEEDDQKNIR